MHGLSQSHAVFAEKVAQHTVGDTVFISHFSMIFHCTPSCRGPCFDTAFHLFPNIFHDHRRRGCQAKGQLYIIAYRTCLLIALYKAIIDANAVLGLLAHHSHSIKAHNGRVKGILSLPGACPGMGRLSMVFDDIMTAAQALASHTAHRCGRMHGHAGIHIIEYTALQKVDLAAICLFIRRTNDRECALDIKLFHGFDHRSPSTHAGRCNQVMSAAVSAGTIMHNDLLGSSRFLIQSGQGIELA